MADAARRRRPRLRAAVLAAALLAGCAPPPPLPPAPAPPPVERLSPAAVETVARLLRAEDRRELDEALLREAAASPSPAVRRQAALALGRLRRPEGASFLAGLLHDADSSVAATAAFALGQLGDSSAVALLAPLLGEASVAARPTVASEAAYALGKLGSTRAHEELTRLLASAEEGAAAPVGSALLAVWRFPRGADAEPIVRWTAAEDPELRWRAAYALTRRPTPSATAVLQRLAADPDPRVRAFALRGLTAPLADSSGLGAAATLPTLLAAVDDEAYGVRINALRALGGYRDARAVGALVVALTAGEGHSVLAAAESLGRLGSAAAEAAPSLRSLALSDSVPAAIRQEALLALARVSPPAAASAAEGLARAPGWRLRAAAAGALSVSAPAAPELARLLRDADGRVAAAALQAVLAAAGEGASPPRARLLEALGSRDAQVRATALGGLARLADPALLPLLLDAYQTALSDSVNDAALAAIDAVGAVDGRGAAPQRAFFARFSRSPDPLARLRARERFGASADSAWGEPLPVETGRSLADYRALVERWIAAPAGQDRDPEVEIVTEAGSIRLRLFAAEAPLTTESLLSLARRGYFDGQEWPRVVPNFVVQGGDPRGDTSGGPGYALRDENNRHRYGTGTLGMALSGPDTGGSQFFASHSPQPHLDGVYTIFGEVVEGQAVTEALLPGDRILTIRIVN